MNSNYQIIILIIASDNTDYYINMQNVWKLYMNTHPHIKSFFIKENNNMHENILVDDNTINVKCEPSLVPGILIKTIKSFEYIYNNYNFKYIYRTNLSSFLDLEKLYTFTINNNFNYAAVIGYCNNNNFGSGAGFFTSKDSTKYLIDKKDINYNKNYDDVVIGEILIPIYSIFPVGRIDFTDYDNKNISDNDIKKSEIFHYRCKNDGNMHHTVYNLQKMYELLYKKV